MRNFLDTASIAQSLDGERLMGCLHYPDQRIFLDQSDYKPVPKRPHKNGLLRPMMMKIIDHISVRMLGRLPMEMGMARR